ncbi:uncharacterized protein LOC113167698 [Anabas testudineus]|uniref:uncharacterized protein LOC113167698 n=1 Tax=Anabas testudineus TaxID=64144 RepID=UPI000E4659FD|nr:uncharacterized protein LOC113167698 [Anabas testudineus]
MKILQCLICCFFLSALQDGNTGLGLVEAETNVYIRSVGDDLSAECSSSASGNMKFLCKETCENENVLMETRDDNAQRGRYSMKYKDGGFLQSPVLTLSITQLMKSDSGRYRCGLGRTLSTASFKQFEVVVADAVLTKLLSLDQKPINKRSGTDLTVAFFFTVPGNTFFFCKEKCEDKNVLVDTDGNSVTKDRYSIEYRDDAFTEGTVFVSITQLKESDSGRYQCGLDRRFFPDSYYDFVVSVTDAPSPTQSLRISSGSFTQTTDQQPNKTNSSGVLMFVGLTVIVMVVLSSLAVLIICIKRNFKSRGSRTRGNSDATNMQFPHYENQPPVSRSEESTYQSLDPATRDQNQIYSTVTQRQHT